MPRMSMGTREPDQSLLWIAPSDRPASPGHPFYARLNLILDAHGVDRYAEYQCREFDAKVMGRPGVPPGQYFRLLLVGCFEGIDSERGRRLIDMETHRAVLTWVQQRLVEGALLRGKTVAIDATTLEANAAMRSIVRRDTAKTHQEFLMKLAKASGDRGYRDCRGRTSRRRKPTSRSRGRWKRSSWTRGYHSNQTMVDLRRRGRALQRSEAGWRWAQLVEAAGRSGAGVWQSPADAWRTGTPTDAAAR
jgi:hypothetical protein